MAISPPSMFRRLFGKNDPRTGLHPLYAAVVAEGRRPHWYVEGGVPDTMDGRFDMIVAILALVLLRLEEEGAAQDSVWLTEIFVDDMDGQLRQEGIGDVVVGKHIGRMMSALGGRIAAYREALAQGDGGAALRAALTRNLYRGEAPPVAALDHVEAALRARAIRLAGCSRKRMLAGDIG